MSRHSRVLMALENSIFPSLLVGDRLDRNVIPPWARSNNMCSQGQDPSSRPAGVWSPGDHSVRLLAQPAGLPVPMPGVPGWFQGVWGRRGAALGRTLCLEADGKGKSRCHLPSDQETQVSFPSARAGAWAAPQQAGGAAASCGTSKTFGQGTGQVGALLPRLSPAAGCEPWLVPARVRLAGLWDPPFTQPIRGQQPRPRTQHDSVPGPCWCFSSGFPSSVHCCLAGPSELSPCN